MSIYNTEEWDNACNYIVFFDNKLRKEAMILAVLFILMKTGFAFKKVGEKFTESFVTLGETFNKLNQGLNREVEK